MLTCHFEATIAFRHCGYVSVKRDVFNIVHFNYRYSPVEIECAVLFKPIGLVRGDIRKFLFVCVSFFRYTF